MILAWLLAAAAAPPATAPAVPLAAPAPAAPLAEARHAIDVGRLDQARLMIARAVAAGSKGPAVDRLLADLAFASGHTSEAAGRYAALASADNADLFILERAGLAALRSGDRAAATGWIEKATAIPGASWRAWNALGVLADLRQDFAESDRGYARAAELAPQQAEVANNMGWSLLLRGEWDGAAAALERAHALDPQSVRIANNLELARAALAEELPARTAGESDEDWAARLNDAGVVAQMRGDNARAIAAFAQAIDARSTWYKRAANNLRRAQESK